MKPELEYEPHEIDRMIDEALAEIERGESVVAPENAAVDDHHVHVARLRETDEGVVRILKRRELEA